VLVQDLVVVLVLVLVEVRVVVLVLRGDEGAGRRRRCRVGVTVVVKFVFILLCNISRIETGVPYSESPRTTFESGPIRIKIRCNLTCFDQFKVLTY
jgi:hypothetical protein